MNTCIRTSTIVILSLVSLHLQAQTDPNETDKRLYIDVHRFTPGKLKFSDVQKAHAKDLQVETRYGVDFRKFWVDEKAGMVYCLSAASDTAAIRKTHAEAHGLLPERIYEVSDGTEADAKNNKNFFLDVHELGAGNVTAANVALAHQKDLDKQGKYGVNFINYWVDEKAGVVLCLSEAKDSTAIINTHKAAHGLLPAYILKVKQGQ